MILRLLLWLDIKVFVLVTLGNCRPGETISAAAWSLEIDGKWQGRVFRPLIDWIFTRLERDHCYQSWMAEQVPTVKT